MRSALEVVVVPVLSNHMANAYATCCSPKRTLLGESSAHNQRADGQGNYEWGGSCYSDHIDDTVHGKESILTNWNGFSYNFSFDKSSFFCATAEAVALGFQHYLVMLGSSIMIPSILVPMMGGSDVRSEPCITSTIYNFLSLYSYRLMKVWNKVFGSYYAPRLVLSLWDLMWSSESDNFEIITWSLL